jgi:type I restriction enzyme, S subunit
MMKSNELPESWIISKVDDLGKLIRGISYKKEDARKSPLQGYKPILRANNINGCLNFDDLTYVPAEIIREEQYIKKGDLIFAMSSGSKHLVGKSAPALNNYDGSYGAFCALLRPSQYTDPSYFNYFFQGNTFRKVISEISKGTNINNLKREHVLEIDFPLPPFHEQHQIVFKIEEFFSELDNGIESLKKARQQLKTYRQAVLKYAFEGKLTQEWREQQKQAGDPPEPAEKLLECIKKEREAHYQKQVEDWKKACEQAKKDGSKRPVKPRKPKDLPPLTEKELVELSELPEGWGWIKLFQFSKEITDGDHQPPPKSLSGIPFITISNIQNNQIDFSSTFYVNENYYSNLKNSRRPEKGDVLYTVTGSYGIPVLINFQKKFCFQRHIGLIRPYEIISKKYVFYLLQSSTVHQQAKKVATGTAQKTIPLEGLRNFKVPLSSNAEQQAIVSEIETRLSVCDKLEKTIEDSLKKAEALRQSILKKAFEGELTKEWRLAHPEMISGENSAESLLARIREEKARLRKNSPQRLKGRRGKSNK